MVPIIGKCQQYYIGILVENFVLLTEYLHGATLLATTIEMRFLPRDLWLVCTERIVGTSRTIGRRNVLWTLPWGAGFEYICQE
jgi:hypothetical protein